MVEQRFNRLNRSSNASQSDRRRQVRGRLIAAFAAAFFFSVSAMGCEEGTTGPTPAGSFQATITGDVVADYQGSGDFSLGHASDFTVYHIRSQGEGTSANQRFRIYHRTDAGGEWHDGLIAEGTHPIVLMDRRDRDARGTSVLFIETVDKKEYWYIAASGSIKITESNKDRAAGTFTIMAIQYCEIELDAPGRPPACPVPSSPPTNAPTIDVSGSFTAVPDDTEVKPGN